jgi:hypothetical protein
MRGEIRLFRHSGLKKLIGHTVHFTALAHLKLACEGDYLVGIEPRKSLGSEKLHHSFGASATAKETIGKRIG